MLEAADDDNGHCMGLSTFHRSHIGHQMFGCHGCYHSYLKQWLGLWAYSSSGQKTQTQSALMVDGENIYPLSRTLARRALQRTLQEDLANRRQFC